MQMQLRRLPGIGDFQMLPGNVYGQAQLKAEPLQNLMPDFWGHASALPAAAPGAILPTQAPTYLFPVNPEVPVQTPAPAAETGKGLSTTTLIIGGALLLTGIVTVALLTR